MQQKHQSQQLQEKRTMYIIFRRILFGGLLFLLCVPTAAGHAKVPKTLKTSIKGFNLEGDVRLTCSVSDLKKHGMRRHDYAWVQIGKQNLILPICKKQTDVNVRAPYIRIEPQKNRVYLAMNIGRFQTIYSVIKSMKCKLTLKKKSGYYDEFKAHQYVITDSRKDYSSDVQFTNFREVRTPGIGAKKLYRSSNPIGYLKAPNRPKYCSKLVAKNNIKTVINLANTPAEIEEFLKNPRNTYYETMYREGNVFSGHITTDMTSEKFMKQIIPAIRFMTNHPAPYLVHCNMGKDRTGYFCALIEALMGASYQDMVDEYMISHENYYRIEKNSKHWKILAKGNIEDLLQRGFLPTKMLQIFPTLAAENIVKKYGITQAEIDQLRENLVG